MRVRLWYVELISIRCRQWRVRPAGNLVEYCDEVHSPPLQTIWTVPLGPKLIRIVHAERDSVPAIAYRNPSAVCAISKPDNVSGRVSRSYCGFVRERGIARTSTTSPTCEALSNSINSPICRVE